MDKRLLVGVDVGTSGAKCIIADADGRVLASSTQEYPLSTPKPGWAEQNPADWWEGVARGLREITAKVDRSRLAGLSLSGQMHGLVALDARDCVIRPAMLWCDQRVYKQCEWITERAGGLEGLLKRTNNRMLTGYTGGKILWLRDNEPENFEKMVTFLCPKDYIRFLLTGEKGIDMSDAAGTGFMDTRNRRWSDELIALAGLDRAIFPEAHESIELAGTVTRAAAEKTGLPEGLNVYFGGGDAVIQTTGAGLVKPGILGVVIGTSGNVSMGLDRFYENPNGEMQMFCNNAPGLWHAFGCPLTSGGAYRWYRDALRRDLVNESRAQGKNVYALMDAEAAQSRPGSNGVVFAPYLSGERCPYPDPNARGMFYGLSLGSTGADMTRAVMEGVTFSLKQVIDILARFAPCEKVYTSGGGSASPLWRQMQADVFDLPVYTMSAAGEGGAYGAVMVAGVGAGVWKNLLEATEIVRVETETLPNRENQKAYRDAFEIYSNLYPALKKTFDLSAEKGW